VVVVSYSGKEINAKLVYYGCGLCGKTTNLESIYEAVPDTSRGKMVSMKTQSDRTLFFDLLPLDLGEIMGFKTRFLLYTVPGQVFYNATRKLVLKGADAIVFVADSEVGKMEENKESLENLRTNLAEYKIDLDEMPWLIQYNKRDLPNVYSIEELQAALNPGGKVPHFEAVATQGKGVFETFRGISHMLMEKVTRELRRGGGGSSSPIRPAVPAESPAPGRTASTPAALPTMASGAPGRAIAREAMESRPPEPIVTAAESPDYGREIDLPDEIPPPTPHTPAMATARPSMHHAPAPEAAPVSTRPSPEPARRAAATQPALPSEASVDRQPHASGVKAAAEALVVPVKLPANGKTGEIVIRIVFERQD
jgi:mutual gliding-motility protein MglA